MDLKGIPDWDSLRKEFPVADKYIYLNNAAIAPISIIVKETIDDCNRRYCDNGIVSNGELLEDVEETRKLAARLLNACPAEISFVKNTTQGIQIAANGIRWKNGDNILVPENEFPANVFPWLNLKPRGVETKFFKVNGGRYLVEDIEQNINNRTRALSVSAVAFTNGFRCDLEAVGNLCREKGIYFIVDAIQALGVLDIDTQICNIDLMAADAHKWLLGPQGAGIAYISESFLERIDVPNLGYKSMTDESDYLNYKVRLKPDASRFEEGTLNIMGITGLKASLDMLLSIGISNIETRVLELNSCASNLLNEMGYIIKSPDRINERSGILSFFHGKISTEEIYQRLFNSNVVCAKRDAAIRISPHFYNNTDDIYGFINALR